MVVGARGGHDSTRLIDSSRHDLIDSSRLRLDSSGYGIGLVKDEGVSPSPEPGRTRPTAVGRRPDWPRLLLDQSYVTRILFSGLRFPDSVFRIPDSGTEKACSSIKVTETSQYDESRSLLDLDLTSSFTRLGRQGPCTGS